MFEGAKLKANWANHMIGQAELGIKRFTSQQPSEIRSSHNRETGELRVQIRGTPAAVPPDVVMLTGTTVQTLLSSLDYITSEIWNSAKEADTRIHFPIDVDQAQLKASGSFTKLHKFNAGLAEFIANDIKPTRAENFSLWALKRLANTDKHRNLLLVSNWNGFEVEEIERLDGSVMQKLRLVAPAGANNEDDFVIPDVKEYREPYAVVQITIREPDIIRPDTFDRLEVIQTLSSYRRAVVETIEAIERHLSK